jgi:hypothetical protein
MGPEIVLNAEPTPFVVQPFVLKITSFHSRLAVMAKGFAKPQKFKTVRVLPVILKWDARANARSIQIARVEITVRMESAHPSLI